jgi:hypothetical protein
VRLNAGLGHNPVDAAVRNVVFDVEIRQQEDKTRIASLAVVVSASKCDLDHRNICPLVFVPVTLSYSLCAVFFRTASLDHRVLGPGEATARSVAAGFAVERGVGHCQTNETSHTEVGSLGPAQAINCFAALVST